MIGLSDEEWEHIFQNQGYLLSEIEENIIEEYFKAQSEDKPAIVPQCYE